MSEAIDSGFILCTVSMVVFVVGLFGEWLKWKR